MATRAELPHFAFPFRLAGADVAVVEQDSADEVAACVEVILNHPIGFRPDLPAFGIPDPAHRQLPVGTEDARVALTQYEPRASVSIEEYGDPVNETIRRVLVTLAEEV